LFLVLKTARKNQEQSLTPSPRHAIPAHANIFASLFDLVGPEDRGTSSGLMNSVGWTGGFLAPVAVGLGSRNFGLSVAIASTAAVYLLVGILALVAAHLAESSPPLKPSADTH
jgi:MFS family permease